MNSKPLQILLADDDDDDCFIFSSALQEISLSTQLTVVPDGVKLMEYLLQNTGNLPDILFLDISMPRKNGIEALEEIKENELLKNLPVVVWATPYHRTPGLEEQITHVLNMMGAVYYIRKSQDSQYLRQIIHEVLVNVPVKKLPPPRC